jgi:hypothetical protein
MADHPSPSGAVTVNLRPVSSPLPVAFAALAVAALVAAGLQLGWYPPTQKPLVGWILLAFPVPMQLIAAAWSFATRTTAATVSTAVLAAAWLATSLVYLHGTPTAAMPAVLGVLELGVAGVLLLMAIAEGTLSALLPALVLAVAAVRFAASGLYSVSGVSFWQSFSGIAGLVLTGVAGYAVLALTLESAVHRPVLPTGRHGLGAAAANGDLSSETVGVAGEPGVRRIL